MLFWVLYESLNPFHLSPFLLRSHLSCGIRFWRRLSKLMSKLNPEPNLIHIMGCYVLGSANGEKVSVNLESTHVNLASNAYCRRLHLLMLTPTSKYAHAQTKTLCSHLLINHLSLMLTLCSCRKYWKHQKFICNQIQKKSIIKKSKKTDYYINTFILLKFTSCCQDLGTSSGSEVNNEITGDHRTSKGNAEWTSWHPPY